MGKGRWLLLSILLAMALFGRAEGGCGSGAGDNPLRRPFEVWGDYIAIGKAHFDDKALADHSFHYRRGRASASISCLLNCKTALRVAAHYNDYTLDWRGNPYFTETHFPEVGLSIAGMTSCIPRWCWIGAIGLFVQTERKASIGKYGTWRGLLYGRYALCKDFGVDIGFLVERGIDNTFIFPIVGFDWCITRRLRADVVFPLDAALTYCINPYLSVAVGARWIRTRLRLGENNPLPLGILEFRTYGAEGRLIIRPSPGFGIELFAGATIDGWIRVENPTAFHLQYENVNGAPYVGAEAYAHF